MACTGQAPSAEINERLEAMRSREASRYAVPDYLAAEWQQRLRDASNSGASVSGPGSSQIDKNCRARICNWCYQIVEYFKFDHEVVSVAISHLDRHLATRTVDRRSFLLASMTALYLAIKTFEPGNGEFQMSSLIYCSPGFMLGGHINLLEDSMLLSLDWLAMEDSMLWSLDWHVHPPTPLAFCREFITLIPGNMSTHVRDGLTKLARFLAKLSVYDYWLATKKASSIAIGAIINAIELPRSRRIDPCCQDEFLCRLVDMGVANNKDEEVIQCYERLRELYIGGGYPVDIDQDDTAYPTGVSGDQHAVPRGLRWP